MRRTPRAPRLLPVLLTPWGERLDHDHPLPEYPRPQLRRDSYLNLNGRWDYAITRSEQVPGTYDGPITVPFSPETALSGVRRVVLPDEVLHYRRWFGLEEGFRPTGRHRVLLRFGAVDQSCRVRVNGRVVAEHVGGYLPFAADVTEALRDGANEVHVAVRDPTDTGCLSRGKQRLDRGGIWYTPQSGIWQTVWLEAVPDPWIEALDLVPDPAAGTLTVTVQRLTSHPGPGGAPVLGPAGPVECEVVVTADGVELARVPGRTGEALVVALPDARPWSPEDPFLHDLEVTAGTDAVRSYAGLRSFGVGPDHRGVPRLLLNGRPYFHAGVLDQGYWPDGGYTAPDDAALVHDIETTKRLGFTMLRKHIKVEPLRWYHHCDRLGLLVWQDLVNGGGRYRTPVVTVPALVPLRLSDHRYRSFARAEVQGRRHWLQEADGTVELLRSVPSLALWTPFNEGWGQFDAAAVVDRVRRLDPTRPVDHASGWHDQGAGDLDSRHVYLRRLRPPRRPRDDRVLALTEYGGYALRVPDHAASPRSFGYRRFRTAAALALAFARLHRDQVRPAVAAGLSATVYTQLADVEDEDNGLLTADRRRLKIPAAVVRAAVEPLASWGSGRLRVPD